MTGVSIKEFLPGYGLIRDDVCSSADSFEGEVMFEVYFRFPPVGRSDDDDEDDPPTIIITPRRMS